MKSNTEKTDPTCGGRRRPGRVRAAGGLLVLALAAGALAADSARFEELKDVYEELARNHDNDAVRERRLVILDMFDVREERGARKLLKRALDDERPIDTRVATVHVLGACGDTKTVGGMLKDLGKEKHRGPVLAIGRGLSLTPPENASGVTSTALKALRKASPDMRAALLEGIGGLAQESASSKLLSLRPKTEAEEFERMLALARCGGEGAVSEVIAAATRGTYAERLAAVIGAGRAGPQGRRRGRPGRGRRQLGLRRDRGTAAPR